MDYFKLSEFKCPCCGKQEMKPEFLKKLDRLRGIAGFPFFINSGWRCKSHNDSLPDSSPDSAHTKGLASDVRCETGHQRFLIITSANRVGFNRIGIAKTFIHLDCDPDKPKEVYWIY